MILISHDATNCISEQLKQFFITKNSPVVRAALQESNPLFNFADSSNFFERRNDLLGVFFVDAFLDFARCAIDDVFGFFEAEAGEFADDLDDLDLLRADFLEDDVELGLFFDFFGNGSGAGDGDGGRGGRDAEFFFKRLDELEELQKRTSL